MKRFICLLLACFCCFSSAFADTIEVPKKNQGIVCDWIHENFPDLSSIFETDEYPGIVSIMIAAQLAQIEPEFDLAIDYKKDAIIYIGQAEEQKNLLFVAYMDPSKDFWLVSIVPNKDYFAYMTDLVSRKKAKQFMKDYCGEYTSVTSKEFYELNELVNSLQ